MHFSRSHLRETDVWGFRGFPLFLFVVVFFGQVSKAFSRGRRGNGERIKKMFGLVKQKRRERKVLCVSLNPSQLPLFSFSESGEGKNVSPSLFFGWKSAEFPPSPFISRRRPKKEKEEMGEKQTCFALLVPPLFSSFFLSPGEISKFGQIDSPKKPPAAGKRKEKETFFLSFSPFRGSLVSAAKEGKKSTLFFSPARKSSLTMGEEM